MSDGISAKSYTDGSYWDKHSTFHEEDGEYKARQCLELLNRNKIEPQSVLDIGCGSGRFLYEMATVVAGRCVGVDLATVVIERARQVHKAENIEFLRSDFRDLSGRFDLVTLNDIFEHVDDYIGFLRSLHGKGRFYYFNIPLDMVVYQVLRHGYMRQRENVGHLHYFSKKSALATLEYSGFEIIDFKYNDKIAHEIKKGPSIKFITAVIPRMILYLIDKDWGVHLLGGASLGMLCKSKL